MLIGVTGGTGFLGRYIVNRLTAQGHSCRCWARESSDRGGFDGVEDRIEWITGSLSDAASMIALATGADAIVHAALDRPGAGFRGAEGDLPTFVERNVVGSIRLIEAARAADVPRFVFISTCALHEVILDDRKLDEAHPLWPLSHYGAYKAAIEKFIHSYGLGEGYEVCSLRPTGIYGLARPVARSKWFKLLQQVKNGEPIESARGGKEVHAGDVARAVELLLTADGVAGQAYNCYDHYVPEQEVAKIAKEITGSTSEIVERNRGAKHQIDTSKIRALGMEFGGSLLLERTIGDILDAM